MQTLSDIAKAVRELGTALVATHVSPDPDAIGSSAALVLALNQAGCRAELFLPEALPGQMKTLAASVPCTSVVPATAVDALIVLDTASERRTFGPIAELRAAAKTVINIDHHSSNPAWGDLNFIRADAASTSVIVFELLQELGWSLGPEIADLLFAGLMDDTGCFRFSNATEESFLKAARLVAAGAAPAAVANQLYFNVPERVLQLRSRALAAMEVVDNGRIAVVGVPKSLLEECHAVAEDTEGIVDFARSVEGTIAAVFLREMDDGWKVSLRSKNDELDVNAIAAQFGGGGHRAAAGCKVPGTWNEARKAVVQAVEKALLELER